MTSLKVAFVGHSYVESFARQKLAYLAQHTNLRLITPSFYPTPFGNYEADSYFNREVPVDSFPIRFVNIAPTSTRWILASRDLGLREFQPDIIHVENEQHSWIVCQAILYRKLYAPKAKLIVFTWDNIAPEELTLKSRMLERLAAFNRRSMDFIICGNRAGQEILAARGMSRCKLDVIPQTGVDSKMFYRFPEDRRSAIRHELEIASEEFAIGFIGRFVEEKGILDLVEAAGALNARSKRSPVLVFMGRGILEGQIRERCAKLGTKLRILPPRKNHEVAEIMNGLDVLVLPSQSRPFWKEQFGRVLIEAMSCGVPVIGSDSGEIPNVIGKAGLVFHEGDREALESCLRTYSDDDDQRREMGRSGQNHALENYTNEIVAQQTLAVYERITR